ncbi:MAG: glycoside hydrolase family 5 protein [Thermogutta sp.]|nr:glycoside hydrolase family 5 protein [Thermogutta sp.]
MKTVLLFRSIVLLAVGMSFACLPPGNVRAGEESEVFSANFEPPAPADGARIADLPEPWVPKRSEGVALVRDPEQGWCLHVVIPPEAGRGSRSVQLKLPVEQLRGTRVRVSARIKADEIAEPPQPYNGVKCMLKIDTPTGTIWPQRNLPGGGWDWKPYENVAAVPANAQSVTLILGLEAVTGQAWFDDVRVRIVGRQRSAPPQSKREVVFKGHALPRLRGAMIGPRVTDEDLLEFGRDWGANHVRWQLIWGGFPRSPADSVGVVEYRRWLESALQRLDEGLEACRRAGILAVIDIHTPPGGRNAASECRMFHEKEFQEAFLRIWEEIAARYREHPAVWGYDLVNEPVEGVVAEGLMTWRELAEVTARRVREIDPYHAIIVEPAPWGSPEALDWFEPLDVPGIVYSVHMYQPHAFTHQGVYDSPVGLRYPGEIGGKYYDKEVLRQILDPVIRYQRDYGVHIYIGEFSAIRWAPDESAYRYLRDCIELFEEYGWDWAYHAFREWDGWSVEHGPDRNDRNRTAAPTQRRLLLEEWFSRNQKPDFSAPLAPVVNAPTR